MINDYIDVPFGTRYFCFWRKNKLSNQIPVNSKEEIVDLINEYNCLANVGLSVGTFMDGVPFLLYLPFDFDYLTLELPLQDACKTFNWFVKRNYRTSLVFSGNKGYHVIVQTVPKVYTKSQIRKMQLYIEDTLKLQTMDHQILGDARRIMRITGTDNMNGAPCELIKYVDGNLLDLSGYYESNGDYDMINLVNNEGIIKAEHPYPCIEQNIVEDPEPSQFMRYAWVCLRRDYDVPVKDMLREARRIYEDGGWEDFREHRTLYQINHILGKGGYSIPSCETFDQLGYCLREDCPYYFIKYIPKKINNKEKK